VDLQIKADHVMEQLTGHSLARQERRFTERDVDLFCRVLLVGREIFPPEPREFSSYPIAGPAPGGQVKPTNVTGQEPGHIDEV